MLACCCTWLIDRKVGPHAVKTFSVETMERRGLLQQGISLLWAVRKTHWLLPPTVKYILNMQKQNVGLQERVSWNSSEKVVIFSEPALSGQT